MTDKDDEMCGEMMKTKGFGWRVSLSIIMCVGWLIFLILWLFFYAANFDVYQNIAIFLVSLLIVGGVLGASWAPWGMKHGNRFDKPKDMPKSEKTEEKKPKVEDEIDKEIEKKNN